MKPHVTLFRIPIRFDFSYVFLVVLFGYLFASEAGDQAALLFALWVPIVTAAILLHELGHALTGRIFGLAPAIVLHGMGGMTQFPLRELRALSHGRRILITLAGPLTGIVIGAALVIVYFAPGLVPGTIEHRILDIATFTTLGWGVLNLVPILPLDGGHIVATVLEKLFGPKGALYARISSIAIAFLLAPLAFQTREPWFLLLLLVTFVLMNWRAYRVEREWQNDEPLAEAIRDAYAALEAGDTGKVRRLAETVRDAGMTPTSKANAAHLLAWAHLIEGDAARSRTALESAPPGTQPDAFLEGSVYLACGEPGRAIAPLVEALADRGDDEVADAVTEAVMGTGRIDELVLVLDSEDRAKKIGPRAFERIAQRLARRGHAALSSELESRVRARFPG